MKIIIGLGNPGKKYENTRHNVGFLAMDRIVNKMAQKDIKVDFKLDKKFEAEVAKLKLGNEDVLLVKPQIFMNLSGVAVKKIVDFYKVIPEKDLMVIYDDVDIPLGKVRIRGEGSSAGHNGLQSIIDELGTDRFMRVRIGIGRPANELVKIEDWVLQALPAVEKELLFNTIEDLIMNGLQYLAL
ncbi:MAG: aminoacyl-tRNA hydrolase [Patescibacteria group bacterium]|nr:aminoacyl-tRNA hydrolase [Patescibacteria group bacterium]